MFATSPGQQTNQVERMELDEMFGTRGDEEDRWLGPAADDVSTG